MAYSTILVHMGNDERRSVRLGVAVELALRFDAFLDVLYIAAPVATPAGTTGRGASAAFGAEASDAVHDRAAQVEEEVHKACRDCSYSWSVIEGDHMKLLTARAAFADLAVLSQSHPAYLEDEVLLHLPDRLPLEAPCPALILPWDGPVEVPGRHLLVAWKNCREAGRALRDALPFLQRADRVTVLTVGFDSKDDSEPTDLSVYLARHGVEAEFHPDPTPDDDAGDVILTCARELDCDAIVMGAYGHSRLRDMMLGSATHTVLSHMHVPVLMAH